MRTALICAGFLALAVLSIQAKPQEQEVGRARAAREAAPVPDPRRRKVKRKQKKKQNKQEQKKNRPKARSQKPGGRSQGRAIVVKGNNCEYITLADIPSNTGCTNGNKFVLKGNTGVRKQFLIMNDKALLAFVTKGAKFTACTAFTDITTDVKCKEVTGLSSVDLSATASATTAADSATTAADSGAAATTAAAAATTAAAAAATTAAAAAATAAPGSKISWALQTSPLASQGFPKYTTVFGVAVFGQSDITDAKFQHMASVLAEWLDNDEDGCVDNALVLSKMAAASPKPATVAMNVEGGLTNALAESIITAGYEIQPTFNAELLPACAGTAATDTCADATLEEVLHLVTATGYTAAYPTVFGTGPTAESKLTKAMDVARGGKFTSIPSSYPSTAWYTYDDATCDYNCMATEYIYWGICSYVGALAGRKTSIANEWKISTKAELLSKDALLSALIQDTATYKAPTVSPDGVYRGATTCASGTAHGGTAA